MKTLLIVLAGLALLAAGWRYVGLGPGTAQAGAVSDEALFTVVRGDLEITVVENGYLKAKNNVEIKPQFDRSSTITWLIEEGTAAEAGTVLAEFEKTDVEKEIEEVKTQLSQYRIELEAAEAELEIQKRDAAAQVETAEFALKMVGLKREKYLEGEGPNEKRKMDLGVEKAESEYRRAEERFDQIPALEAQGFYTKLEVERERIGLREAEINLENARSDRAIWETYTDPMEREQIEVDLKNAERDLRNAEEKAQINIKENEARVFRNSSRVKSTEQRLAELEKELGHLTIRAPSPGVVHYGDPRNPWLRDQIKLGNSLWRGNTVFTLPDLREMQVLVQVHEADIDLVKLGQDVLVTVEAVKGRVFPGQVTQIAAVASSDWMDEANKTFRVEVSMEPIEGAELRAGITAKCEIEVETLPGVLQVPIHAVVAEGGRHFCFVPDEAGFEQRTVEIGKNNAHYVVIASGLGEGDEVLLYDPREGTAATEEAGPGPGPEPEAEEALAPGIPAPVSPE